MKQLLQQGLEDRAFGLSSCLIFAPGSYSKTEGLVLLADVDSTCVGHARGERDDGRAIE